MPDEVIYRHHRPRRFVMVKAEIRFPLPNETMRHKFARTEEVAKKVIEMQIFAHFNLQPYLLY